jgi:hypothetical protein
MDFSTTEPFGVQFSEDGTRATKLIDDVGGAAATPSPTHRVTISTEALPPTIVASWGPIQHADMSSAMYDKLVRLASAPAGRVSVSDPLNASSLRHFLQFWSMVRDEAVEPELGLAPDGSIHAEWFKSVRQRLDVRFAGSKARFGLFTSNNILEGAENLTTVAKILKLHHAKPLKWGAP